MPLEHPADAQLEASTNRWMTWGGVLLLAFALAFPLYRAVEPNRRADAQQQRVENLAILGTDLFGTNCAQCHGSEGRGGLAPALRSKQFLLSATDSQISQLIAVGVPGSQMASYGLDFGGPLTSEQVDAIVVYLRSLEAEAPDFPAWRFPLAQEGLTGKEIYNLACASCHGVGLSGDKDFPPLGPGSDAQELSDARLARQISQGEDAMPAFGGTLSQEQIAAVIDYLRTVQAGG